MKIISKTTVLVATVGGFLVPDLSFGVDFTVELSDGDRVTLTEPVDVVSATWETSKDALPRVFLLVDEGLKDKDGNLVQLLTTARVIGLLYLNRADKITGGSGGDFDMSKAEEARDNALKGKLGPEAKEALKESDAVTVWWSMLEDRARELKGKFPNDPRWTTNWGLFLPNTSMIFMNAYADMIKDGDDSEIYSEIVARIAKNDPLLFSSYLAKTTPERRQLLERLVKSHVP